MDIPTLLQHFEEVFNNLLSYDFPLPVDNISTQIHLTHKSGYYGICQHKRQNGTLYHTIGINTNFVANGTDKAIINTLYHELLHTLPNCQNHGPEWKRYAKRVKDLFGYDVRRTGGDKTAIDYESLK